MDANQRRLQELLSRVLDDASTDAEREEFRDLLKQDPQLAAGIVPEVFVHSLLLWQSEDISECLDMEAAANVLASAQLTSSAQLAAGGELEARLERPVAAAGKQSSRQSGRKRDWRSWSWAAAVCLLVAAWLALWEYRSRDRADLPERIDHGAIAEIIAERDVFWSNASTGLRDGRLIYPGRLETNAGAYTLKFRSGPTMHVSGGSSLQIESDMLVRLEKGQATAHVPKSGVGFTIKTAVVNVIDLGTQFGVAVADDGNTDVVVFEGRVDLQDTTRSPSPATKQLVRGEGVRISPQGAVGRLMQIQRDLSKGWWTIRHPESAAHVIAEVSDTIPPADGARYFCYQITHHGLKDDAYAYADHQHQWNGLTAAGLPDFLRGADYVQTFNDYRYLNEFKMTVRLARPANLYVLFDDRVPLPDWLTEKFEDTGVDVGLDEGPWPEYDQSLRPDLPEKVNAAGGGQSIDNSFSVWRRRCETTDPVKLGPVGASNEARAMYGVAATPLE